jgi:hypothetical protein
MQREAPFLLAREQSEAMQNPVSEGTEWGNAELLY